MRKITLILMLLMPLLALHTHAQNKLKDVANKLEDLNKKLPIEKAHLHLDKPYYSVGDTIWVKAYVVDRNNQFSNISNLLYVDVDLLKELHSFGAVRNLKDRRLDIYKIVNKSKK